MEAETYVEPQVSIELLSEYADKLRLLADLWYKHYQRRQFLRTLESSAMGLLFAAFFFMMGGIAFSSSTIIDNPLTPISAISIGFGLITLVTFLAIFMIGRIISISVNAHLESRKKDIVALIPRFEKLIRTYSQIAEHGKTDKSKLSELDIRMRPIRSKTCMIRLLDPCIDFDSRRFGPN